MGYSGRVAGRLGRWLVAGVALTTLVSESGSLAPHVSAQTSSARAPSRMRATFAKPAQSTLAPSQLPGTLIVKFREGTRVRLRDGRLVAPQTADVRRREVQLRQRFRLDAAIIASDLETVNLLVGPPTGVRLDRLFGRPEQVLEAEQMSREASSDDELADLNLYYVITTPTPDRAAAEILLDRLNALDSVEIAYAESEAKPAGDIAPMTADFTSAQDFLGVFGIDADYAYARNARGQGVKIIDVEGNWDFAHEDVPPMFSVWGFPFGSDFKKHGTAVLGVLAAGDNGYGMRGIAPSASVGASAFRYLPFPGAGWYVTSVARAIDEAAEQLGPGDVILIELQRSGPDSGAACSCGCDDFEYIPVEYDGATFDAIRHATAAHIVVVAGAGNGSMNLDHDRYDGRFDRAVRDSGAILVGASTGTNERMPTCWTNHGSRVDVQGWGTGVATLGGGDLAKINGSDQRQWYRQSFGGTSAGSAIVAGAAAAFQSALIARGLPRLFPEEMRYVMTKVGYPQGESAQHIGPLPSLRPLIRAYEQGDTCEPITILDTLGEQRTFLPPFGQVRYCFSVSAAHINPYTRYAFETCANPAFDTFVKVQLPIRAVVSNNDGCGAGSRASRVVLKPSVPGVHTVNVKGVGNAAGDLILRFYRLPPEFEPGD
jgi:serine protease